ncbi:MAG: endonuclease/exonuclease/phosphatase family protein [Actinomycetota bacterium]
MAIKQRVRAAFVLLFALLVGPGSCGLQPAGAGPSGHARERLTVATYNLYLGADLIPIFSASSEEELVRLAGEAYAQMVRTDFPSRARAIAKLLARDPPDIVGLQEVALWETGPIGDELTPSYDFLAILLSALEAQGLTYRAEAVNENFSGEMAISATMRAKFTDRDVILARRAGLADLDVSGPQSHNFVARLVLPTRVPGVVFIVSRGWSAVDVEVNSTTIRVANTHLEAFEATIRTLQAVELRGALAGSRYPVVVLGDFNSEPTDTAGAYGIFTRTGYADAWAVVHGPQGGFTAGQTSELDNLPSQLDHRIVYALYEPEGVQAVAATVIGEELDDRTPAGRWPSDHAGLVVRLASSHRIAAVGSERQRMEAPPPCGIVTSKRHHPA